MGEMIRGLRVLRVCKKRRYGNGFIDKYRRKARQGRLITQLSKIIINLVINNTVVMVLSLGIRPIIPSRGIVAGLPVISL